MTKEELMALGATDEGKALFTEIGFIPMEATNKNRGYLYLYLVQYLKSVMH